MSEFNCRTHHFEGEGATLGVGFLRREDVAQCCRSMSVLLTDQLSKGQESRGQPSCSPGSLGHNFRLFSLARATRCHNARLMHGRG